MDSIAHDSGRSEGRFKSVRYCSTPTTGLGVAAVTPGDPTTAPGLPIPPEELPIAYHGDRRVIAEATTPASETVSETPDIVAAGGLSVPPSAWPPSEAPSPRTLPVPATAVAPGQLAAGQVVVIYALESIVDCLYRVSRTRTDNAGGRSIVRLIPAAADRDPLQAVPADGAVRLRDATTGDTIARSAVLYLAPDRPLATAYIGPAESVNGRPALRDPVDPTVGARVTTVGEHDVVVADPPAGRTAEPTHVSFVLRCAGCDYTIHPHIKDTNELADVAETKFGELACPPAFEEYVTAPYEDDEHPPTADHQLGNPVGTTANSGESGGTETGTPEATDDDSAEAADFM